MPKIKLISVSKTPSRCAFAFRKDETFFSGFRGFLSDLGFDMEEFSIRAFGRPSDDEYHEPDETRDDDIIKYG